MENVDQRVRVPQDIGISQLSTIIRALNWLGGSSLVAIFHASFHPTKGNVVDWCLKANDGKQRLSGFEFVLKYLVDLQLDGVEFSTLPSGLHLVDHDVVCVQLGPRYLAYIHRDHP